MPVSLEQSLYLPMPRTALDINQLSCVGRPAQTEGPYFVDERLNRTDIRSDPATGVVKPGVPLRLKINVSRVTGTSCAPLVGALVDLWHCDALGIYYGVSAGMGNPDTRGQKFFRGYQVSNASGDAEFLTIYPGYYIGRTAHLHYKVRLFDGAMRTFDFTSQIYFDDSLTDQVYTQAPYNSKQARGTRNNNDGIYSNQALITLTADGQGGYQGTFNVGLSNVPASVAAVSTVSAASFASGALASEAIASLFGMDLATSTVSATTTPLPTTLGGVQVRVRDAVGTERLAPLFFASPTQINFQIPAGTTAGNSTITVLRNATAIGQNSLVIDAVAPGLFTANATGQGVPAAAILRVRNGVQTYEPVAQFDATQNRQVAVPIDLGPATDQVFFVGFGTGFRNRSGISAVTSTIGGTNADVLFAGAQGQLTGVDQVNILIPHSLAGRGAVDLVLRVDGKAANTVSLNLK